MDAADPVVESNESLKSMTLGLGVHARLFDTMANKPVSKDHGVIT
jgi:hypothetical protein